MKRNIGIIVVGLIALAAVSYVATQLWAQAPGGVRPASATAPASGKTRVAILNLKYVVTSYKKWTAFQEQYKSEFKVFEDRITPLKKQYEDKAKAIKEGKLDTATREAYEKDLRNLQLQMQVIDDDARRPWARRKAT